MATSHLANANDLQLNIYLCLFQVFYNCFLLSIGTLNSCLETLTDFTIFSSWSNLSHVPALKLMEFSDILDLKVSWKLLFSLKEKVPVYPKLNILMEAVLFLVRFTKSKHSFYI